MQPSAKPARRPNPRPPWHRSLHAAVAARVRRDPELWIGRAHDNLQRWAERYPITRRPSWIAEWDALLNGPMDDILEILLGDSERAQRLRQSSPFSNVLSPSERWAIIKAGR